MPSQVPRSTREINVRGGPPNHQRCRRGRRAGRPRSVQRPRSRKGRPSGARRGRRPRSPRHPGRRNNGGGGQAGGRTALAVRAAPRVCRLDSDSPFNTSNSVLVQEETRWYRAVICRIASDAELHDANGRSGVRCRGRGESRLIVASNRLERRPLTAV